MSLDSLQRSGAVPSFDALVRQAMGYDIAKLEAIIRGQQHVPGLPATAAMTAYEMKKPAMTAVAGQQAQQQLQQSQPTVRQEMVQPAIPDMAMLQQQQAGPQPPVLPEQGGVGALPAPNMQGMAMAHGGIIAFDDGGNVPGYAGDDESLVDEYYGLPFGGRSGSEEYWQRPVMPYGEQMRNVGRAVKRGAKKLFSIPDTEVDKEEEEAQKKKAKKSKEKQYKPYPTDIKKPTAVDPTAGQAVTDANANPLYTPPEKLPPEKKLGEHQAAVPRALGIPAALPTAKPYTAQDALEAQQSLTGAGDAEMRGMLDRYKKETATGIEALKTERERTKPAGEAYSKYEESLQKEEAAAKGKEDKNLQMALVNAGLAMMSGTSRYALENIGKGAMVGTKQYMDGIDKLEAAAKKRQEALAMVEQARRAESRDDWKSANDFAAKAFELNQGVQKTQIEAISKLTGQNKTISADLLTKARTDEEAMKRTLVQEKGAKERALIAERSHKYAADAYGGRQLTPAMAVKEANDAYEKWAATSKGEMELMKPGTEQRKRREILIQTFKDMGIPLPPGVGDNLRPPNLPPLSPTSTPNLFK